MNQKRLRLVPIAATLALPFWRDGAVSHGLSDLVLLELRRDIELSSTTIRITHEGRLRPRALEDLATLNLLDKNPNRSADEVEPTGFLENAADHLTSDFLLRSSRILLGEPQNAQGLEALPTKVECTNPPAAAGAHELLRVTLAKPTPPLTSASQP